MLSVNKELLPVKLHYFLKFAVSAMQNFNPLFARQKGIPPDIVGLIWSLFPMFTVTTMMIITNLADRFKTHRGSFLTLTIIFLTAEAMISFGPDITKNVEEIKFKYINMSCQNGDVISISNINQHEGFLCESDLNSSQTKFSSFKCSVDPNVNSELNVEIQTHIEKSVMNISSVNVNIQGLIEGINLNNQTKHLLCQDNHTLSCIKKCTSNENNMNLMNITMLEIIKYPCFWLLLIALLMFECSNFITSSLCDMASLQLLGSNTHKFGLQRVWGTLGYGIMALVYGAAIDYFSEGGHKRNYSAGYFISMVLWILAFIPATQIKFVDTEKKEKANGSVLEVLNSFKVVVFMACILIIGMSLGYVWTFLFLLMEDVANVWDPGFANLNLLQGLCLSIGCFAGEVPTMFFSGAIIEYIGNVHTFSLVLVIISARFIIYAFIRNPWLFLPVEILHGISFGLFYPNMSAYANKIAPPGRYATMQGLVNSMLSVGTSLGALIGGTGFKLFGGAQMFLYVGLADIFFVVIYIICHIFINKHSYDSGSFEKKKRKLTEGFAHTHLKEESSIKSQKMDGYGTMDLK